jgi:E3 ubiquitin-protein ligase RAD18
MMKEGALRKKLQEIGIPNWGSKDLMKRRHIEWLNIHNSNCDADDSVRKTKRQLVRELEEWENTQGGRADVKENRVMRKDFDGNGYAKSHKSDFDDLIMQARKKRAVPKLNDGTTQQSTQPSRATHTEVSDAPDAAEQLPRDSTNVDGVAYQHLEPNHGSTLATGSQAAQSTNQVGPNSTHSSAAQPENQILGIQNPLGSPSRKVPMFAMPEEPVKEVDMSAQ